MDINELTIGQARELANIFTNQTQSTVGLNTMIGKKCVVRTKCQS